MASELEKKIIRQIEYYFGDINLSRDRFMQEKIAEDDGDGWVSLDVLLTFKRLANFSKDPKVITGALKKTENDLVQVSEDGKKIRRNPDLPPPEQNDAYKEELTERTAYAKGFPFKESFDEIMDFMEQFGPVDSVTRRKTKKDRVFKGSCFIIFKDKDTCKRFVEMESVKYNGKELIRHFQNSYLLEKKREYEERVRSREDKKQAKLEETKKLLEKFPKGAVLHFTVFPEGKIISREEIKAKVGEKIDKTVAISFIEFSRGDVEGYLRFSAENAAVEFMKTITGEVEVGDVKLKFNVLEGTEEENYLRRAAEAGAKRKEKFKSAKKNKNRKGKKKASKKSKRNEESKKKK